METELSRLHEMVGALLKHVPDHVISNTHAQKAVLIASGIGASKVSVIPNGVDVKLYPSPACAAEARRLLNIPQDGPVIGMIGSFRPLKRWDVFLKAAALVAKTRPVQILCVGDGALRAEMEAMAVRLGVASSTHFLGTRADVPSIMPALDVLVSASDTEGLSNVILEAMASSVPVVATEVGGTPELISDGQNGLLVVPGNVEHMSRQISLLLSNLSMAREMGAQGRIRVEREFSIERCVDLTIAVYESMLARRRNRRGRFRASAVQWS